MLGCESDEGHLFRIEALYITASCHVYYDKFLSSWPALLAIDATLTRVRQPRPFAVTFGRLLSPPAKAARSTWTCIWYGSGVIAALSQSKLNWEAIISDSLFALSDRLTFCTTSPVPLPNHQLSIMSRYIPQEDEEESSAAFVAVASTKPAAEYLMCLSSFAAWDGVLGGLN